MQHGRHSQMWCQMQVMKWDMSWNILHTMTNKRIYTGVHKYVMTNTWTLSLTLLYCKRDVSSRYEDGRNREYHNTGINTGIGLYDRRYNTYIQQTVKVHNRKFTTTEQQEGTQQERHREAAEQEVPRWSASSQKKVI